MKSCILSSFLLYNELIIFNYQFSINFEMIKFSNNLEANKKSALRADFLVRRVVESNHILMKNSQGISLEPLPCGNTLHLSPQIYFIKGQNKNNPKKILGLFSRIPRMWFLQLIPVLSIANHKFMSRSCTGLNNKWNLEPRTQNVE